MATTLVRGVMTSGSVLRSSRPSVVTATALPFSVVHFAGLCHGLRLAWGPISETTISSPGPSRKLRPAPSPPPELPLEKA